MDSLEILERLPHELKAALEADSYFFSDIPIVVADEGNIEATIKQRMAVLTQTQKKIGVAVVVLQVLATDLKPGVRMGPMNLYPAFQVIELPEVNRGPEGTQKPARRVARRIVTTIKGFYLADFITDMRPDNPSIEPVDAGQVLGSNVISYLVNFECLEQMETVPKQVEPPRFAMDGQTIVVSCATENAEIYFTLDDSSPLPKDIKADTTATLYAVPIPITAAGYIRARAFRHGWLPSGVSRAQITPA